MSWVRQRSLQKGRQTFDLSSEDGPRQAGQATTGDAVFATGTALQVQSVSSKGVSAVEGRSFCSGSSCIMRTVTSRR